MFTLIIEVRISKLRKADGKLRKPKSNFFEKIAKQMGQ